MSKTTDFWKTALAAGVGVVVVSAILSIISSIIFAGIIASVGTAASASKGIVEPNSVLDIDFSTVTIAEQTLEENPLGAVSVSGTGFSTGEEVRVVGVLDAVRALEAAAEDPCIKFAYLRPDMANDISHLEEFRAALVKFRSSGKPVISYIQTPTNAGYYLASASDRIYISEYHGGMNMMIGLSGSMMFFKDLLDRLGVNVQLIRHGKYKSAGEMYIKNSASPENLEQNTVMVKGIWNEMVAAMTEKSGMSADEFNTLIDNLELVDAQDFVKKGLADEAVSMQGMKTRLCAQAGEDEFDDIESISLADYAAIKNKENMKAHDKIAVIYVDGEIIDGREKEEVAGKRFADLIDEVADKESVKAVVLRVNSPGGSVIASSQIRDAVDRLQNSKPVVASYGSYAASGGYWISSGCDYIFSDATTLTGSIGVFGMIPEFSGTLKNIVHVNITSVPSNRHSDMYSFTRPLDDTETAFVQKDIEAIYTQFTSLVAEGRKMSVEKVDEIGQGRVWTGRDALEIGLVDKIGGLADALDYASEISGSTLYRVVSYPKPLTIMEQLMESFQPSDDDELVSIEGVGKGAVKALGELASMKTPAVYARLPYNIDIR